SATKFTFPLSSHTRIFLRVFTKIGVSLPRVNRSNPMTTLVNLSHEMMVSEPPTPPPSILANHRKPM
ncbi:MAG: hypothetical protein NC453_29935, partial [Muribaculum sp.]|nr:hypothetical protein [Muribaculum sp.]